MSKARRATSSGRELLRVYAPAALLTVVGFIVAYQFVDPAPPRAFAMASGSTDGAYHAFAQAYRRILAREGIELEVLTSAGSVENLRWLADESNAIDVGFVQGGVGTETEAAGLFSLGSLYFEPLWVFHRLETEPVSLVDLEGRRIAVGPAGSGTRAAAMLLLGANGVTAPPAAILPLGGQEAAAALQAGAVDAVFLVASPRSPVVADLLRAPGVRVIDFARAEAYTRLYRFLSRVVLPAGIVDLRQNIPSHDVTLLAPTANLVATERLHPALVDLLLQAAQEVHGPGGWFEGVGQFPSPQYVDFPLSPEARRFYKSGPSFLQRYLPFWAATLIDRTLVLLLPFFALLVPLLRVMPPLYRWRMRRRIYRWYGALLATDPDGRPDPAEAERGLEELRRIEAEVARVEVPASYADQLYHLHAHIELVRSRLKAAGSTGPAEGTE